MKQGTLLDVDVTASRLKVPRGKPVTFTAVVRRAGSGERLRYSWYFDDRESARGRRVTHRFARAGSYDVVVGVTAPGDDVGASATVTIQVGKPRGGPDRKGGGSDPDEEAPDSGAATGKGGAAGGEAAAGAKRAAARQARRRSARHARKRSRPRNAAAPGEGNRIAGNLLADAGGPESQPRAAAIRAARTGRPDEGGASVPVVAWQLGGLLVLLAAGATLELRPPRRRAAP
jgi:PKD domain